MSNKKSLTDRVKDYIAGSKDIEPKGMAELSPRAVGVIDKWNETYIYFDAESYKIKFECIWKDDDGKNCLFPPALEGTGLGVLAGVGYAPQVRGYHDAIRFAKRQLEPIVKEAQWYDNPVKVK